MTTRADLSDAEWAGRSATGRQAATAFARLLGMAFVISVAMGLLLTAAAVALPAPLVGGDAPVQIEGTVPLGSPLPIDALVALAALILAGFALKGRSPVPSRGRSAGNDQRPKLHCRVGRSFPRRGPV